MDSSDQGSSSNSRLYKPHSFKSTSMTRGAYSLRIDAWWYQLLLGISAREYPGFMLISCVYLSRSEDQEDMPLDFSLDFTLD